MGQKSPRISRKLIIAGALVGLLVCVCVGVVVWQGKNFLYAKHPWVRSLAWSPDDSYLAVGSADNSITVWDVRSAKLLRTITKHTSYVRSLAWSPDGRLLASGGGDGSVFLWEPLTGTLVRQILNSQNSLGYCSWSPDGSVLAYAGDSGSIMWWDEAVGGKPVAQSKSAITGIAWSPDGTRMVTSTMDGAVTVWGAQESPTWSIPAHKGWANGVGWSSDGNFVASGGDDAQIDVWDARTGKLLHNVTNPVQIWAVAWSPTLPPRLAWASKDEEITISDFAGSELRLHPAPGIIYSLAWTHDGKYLAAGLEDGTVQIWELSTGKQSQLLTVPTH
jgi:WD40 repeat protein